MKKQATKSIVLGIMSTQSRWYPWQVNDRLMAMDIFVSESTLTRKFRSWPEIQSIQPDYPKECKAWTYKVIA